MYNGVIDTTKQEYFNETTTIYNKVFGEVRRRPQTFNSGHTKHNKAMPALSKKQMTNLRCLERIGVLNCLGLTLSEVSVDGEGSIHAQNFLSHLGQRIADMHDEFMASENDIGKLLTNIFQALELYDEVSVGNLFSRCNCSYRAKCEINGIRNSKLKLAAKKAFLANWVSAFILVPVKNRFIRTPGWVFDEAQKVCDRVRDVVSAYAPDALAKWIEVVDANNPLLNPEYKTTGFDDVMTTRNNVLV